MLYVDKVTHFDMIMMFHMTMTTGKVPPPQTKVKEFFLAVCCNENLPNSLLI